MFEDIPKPAVGVEDVHVRMNFDADGRIVAYDVERLAETSVLTITTCGPLAELNSPSLLYRPFRRILKAEDFRQITLLGGGSSAVVLLVEDTFTGENFVMKMIKKKGLKDGARAAIFAEQDILRRLADNPFFTELKGSFEDTKYFYLIMEYAPRGNLCTYIMKNGDGYVARMVMAELVTALETIHKMRIIHRDVKPGNILVNDNYHVILGDFGLAKDFGFPPHERPWATTEERGLLCDTVGDCDKIKGWFGTTGYIAPEVYCDWHSYEADIWSAGVVLFQLFTGKLPFDLSAFQDTVETLRKTVTAPLVLDEVGDEDARDLLRMMLQRNPHKRPTWSQIKAHEFFKRVNWEKIAKREKAAKSLRVEPSNTMKRPYVIVPYGKPCKPGRQVAPWFEWVSPRLQAASVAVVEAVSSKSPATPKPDIATTSSASSRAGGQSCEDLTPPKLGTPLSVKLVQQLRKWSPRRR